MRGHSGTTRMAGCAVLVASMMTMPLAAQNDNTSVNKRDRAPDAVTADQQTNHQSDLDMTKRIRQAIVGDKDLSTYAHNIKVVTRGGKVTLKGPVRSQQEKAAVEAKANEIAGAANVMSSISVTGQTTRSAKTQKTSTHKTKRS